MDSIKIDLDKQNILEIDGNLYEVQKKLEQRWWDLHDELKQGYDSKSEQRAAMREQSQLFELIEKLSDAKTVLQDLRTMCGD